MRFSRQLTNIAIFVAAAVLVYLAGAALFMARPMWAMMGGGPGLSLLVLAAFFGLGAAGLIARDGGRKTARDDERVERCPRCRAPVESDYILCPECHTALGRACPECRQPLKKHWSGCPRCGADVVPATASQVVARGE